MAILAHFSASTAAWIKGIEIKYSHKPLLLKGTAAIPGTLQHPYSEPGIQASAFVVYGWGFRKKGLLTFASNNNDLDIEVNRKTDVLIGSRKAGHTSLTLLFLSLPLSRARYVSTKGIVLGAHLRGHVCLTYEEP